MSAAIALRMTLADILKLRKKRGTIIWAALLVFVPLILYFVIRAAQHSSSPVEHGPAGGLPAYQDGMHILGMLFGPLAAILIGVEAGTGDLAAGVFRDLVVTGRSRLALFATRVPAALAVTWMVVAGAFGLLLLGVFAFASSLPTPSGALIAEGVGFVALETGVLTAFAVGFGSLVGSKPGAITAVIAWEIVASPLIANIESLGGARSALLSESLGHFSPVATNRAAEVSMGTGTAIVVIAAWLIVALALGAWRTRRMDA